MLQIAILDEKQIPSITEGVWERVSLSVACWKLPGRATVAGDMGVPWVFLMCIVWAGCCFLGDALTKHL